ncbi:ras oncogene family protein, putative [Ichthyophthirius multifiliis]|uniref:Ras oncogene family protein, putative n=1 Tax=Ichthyophthirius multifiliis TaxID=5932 RepID=G0QSJ2_ICHMU|nr:ras oncogene family protein, putative [Ichthyophthirius multifiliis]EGR31830.1 ras oncogene family protein, putative [Ichthyophthirius multifiliis]|eukprot:XP_004035316.1 ras oncogene family protein, putative [Ichthyophthirius multifiliis]
MQTHIFCWLIFYKNFNIYKQKIIQKYNLEKKKKRKKKRKKIFFFFLKKKQNKKELNQIIYKQIKTFLIQNIQDIQHYFFILYIIYKQLQKKKKHVHFKVIQIKNDQKSRHKRRIQQVLNLQQQVIRVKNSLIQIKQQQQLNKGVGKSCLLIRYTKNEFASDYNATIGVEFQSKTIKISDAQVKLQIWDTAGQESFRSIIKSFYKKTFGVFLVYSINNRDSFNSILHWYNEAKENAEESALFVLVGTQRDRECERKVTKQQGEQLQKDLKLDLFYEVSSKDGDNIDLCFEETAKMAFLKQINQNLKNKSIASSSFMGDAKYQIQPNQNNQNQQKSKCC